MRKHAQVAAMMASDDAYGPFQDRYVSQEEQANLDLLERAQRGEEAATKEFGRRLEQDLRTIYGRGPFGRALLGRTRRPWALNPPEYATMSIHPDTLPLTAEIASAMSGERKTYPASRFATHPKVWGLAGAALGALGGYGISRAAGVENPLFRMVLMGGGGLAGGELGAMASDYMRRRQADKLHRKMMALKGWSKMGALIEARSFCESMEKAAGGETNVVIEKQDGDAITVRPEVAKGPKELRQGLMYRESLKDGEGMLFRFPAAAPRFFWMKNVPIALDMIFAMKDGTIVHIEHNATPMSEDPRGPNAPVKDVMEVPGGFCQRHGVREGDRLLVE